MRRTLLLLFTMGSLTGPLRAQTPADRQHLAALSDSAMAAIERRPANAFAWTRNGILHLQAGTRSDSIDLIRTSLTDFYEATVKAPKWPYAWYGLGLAKLQLEHAGARVVVSPHQPAGNDWLNGARQAFTRAFRADSTFAPSIDGLVHVLLLDSLQAGRSPTAELVERWASHNPVERTTALALARYWIEVHDFAKAEQYVTRFRSQGGAPGLGAWEMARIAFATERPELGATEYYQALAELADPAVLAIIRADFALVADPEELIAFDHLPADSVVGWARQFWAGREIEAGRPAGSRLPVHFARIQYAWDHFRTYARIEQYNIAQIYRGAPRGLDDRGVIWVRHGEPDQRATYIPEGAPPNESWMYYRTTGNLIFHFAKFGYPPTPYRLLETLAAIKPIKLLWWISESAELFESRDYLEPEYTQIAFLIRNMTKDQRAANLPPASLTYHLQREMTRSRAAIAIGTTTDSDPIELERSWAPIAQAFGAPATSGKTAGLIVAIALPLPADLTPVPLTDGESGYVVRLRATAADDSGRTTLDVDSLVRLRTPRPLAKGEFLNIVRSYSLAPGTQSVRVIVTDSAGERGAIRIFSGVPTVDLSTPEFALSDIVVGRSGSGVQWRAPDGTTVPLHPLNAWTLGQPLEVTFGVAGLQTGVAYKVRIAIADLGADSTRPPRASVEFENQASGTRELVSQSLGLQTLRPGRYLLTVTVTAGTRSIRRERRITVVKER